jgi:RNA polymerase sigma-70 factor (ECF subfamily)
MHVTETSTEGEPEVRAGLLRERGRELDEVVTRNLCVFYKRAYRYLGNAPDAEDAVQDALLSAYKHVAQFRGQAQLSTWLTTIVTNAALMKLRRRRGVWLSLEQQNGEDGLTFSEVIPDSRPDPEQICVSSDAHNKLLQVANQLSPTLRKTFQLRDIDGLTTKETAHLLGVPEGTVKAQIARARGKLARIMQLMPRRPRSRPVSSNASALQAN